MCYSEPLYEERKKQLNSTTNVSISEEISSGVYMADDGCNTAIKSFQTDCLLRVYIYIYIYIYIK